MDGGWNRNQWTQKHNKDPNRSERVLIPCFLRIARMHYPPPFSGGLPTLPVAYDRVSNNDNTTPLCAYYSNILPKMQLQCRIEASMSHDLLLVAMHPCCMQPYLSDIGRHRSLCLCLKLISLYDVVDCLNNAINIPPLDTDISWLRPTSSSSHASSLLLLMLLCRPPFIGS